MRIARMPVLRSHQWPWALVSVPCLRLTVRSSSPMHRCTSGRLRPKISSRPSLGGIVTASPTAWTNTVPGAGGSGRRVRDGGGTPVSLPPIRRAHRARPSPGSATRHGTPPDPNGVDVGHTRGRGAGMAADVATLAAELAAHADAEARIAAALVELERHPGHVALAAGTSTGVTAARWAAASAQLATLWEDFAAYRSAL